MLRRDLGVIPGHGIVLLEAVMDAGLIGLDEAREVGPRTHRREQAAGIVVAIVDAGLIGIAGPLEQVVVFFQQHDAACVSPQMLGDHAAVESAANDDCIASLNHAAALQVPCGRRSNAATILRRLPQGGREASSKTVPASQRGRRPDSDST